jgi:hypothetical protein
LGEADRGVQLEVKRGRRSYTVERSTRGRPSKSREEDFKAVLDASFGVLKGVDLKTLVDELDEARSQDDSRP